MLEKILLKQLLKLVRKYGIVVVLKALASILQGSNKKSEQQLAEDIEKAVDRFRGGKTETVEVGKDAINELRQATTAVEAAIKPEKKLVRKLVSECEIGQEILLVRAKSWFDYTATENGSRMRVQLVEKTPYSNKFVSLNAREPFPYGYNDAILSNPLYGWVSE